MVWRCPPLNLPNWNHLWKWKTEMKQIKEGCLDCEQCTCDECGIDPMLPFIKTDMVKSPCVGKCTYDITIQQCNDCGRTKEEISTWYVMTDDEKLAVLERLMNG